MVNCCALKIGKAEKHHQRLQQKQFFRQILICSTQDPARPIYSAVRGFLSVEICFKAGSVTLFGVLRRRVEGKPLRGVGRLVFHNYCVLFTVNCSLCQGGFTNFFRYVASRGRRDNPTGEGGEKNPTKNGHPPSPYGFSPRAPFSPLPLPLVRFFS